MTERDDNCSIKSCSTSNANLLISEDSSSDDGMAENMAFRRRRIYIAESDSESDTDEEEIKPGKRALRVNSSSDSSSSDVIVQRARKNTKLKPETDDSSSNDESDWESLDENEDKPGTSQMDASRKEEEASSSDSNDGQMDKCPICLVSLKNQEVASPDACDHSFCAECIQEWAKTINTCPVDRKKFDCVLVRNGYHGEHLRKIKIPKPTNVLGGVGEDEIVCEICGSSAHEDRLLLCDGCDLGFHLDCLNPPLNEVPIDDWYCQNCIDNPTPHLVNNIQFNMDVVLNMDEMLQFQYFWNEGANQNLNNERLINPTRRTERIRTLILNQRAMARNNAVATPQPGPSTARRPRNTAPKKPKRKYKRKSKKPRYKTTYELDKKTGEKVAVKKKIRRYRKTRRYKKKRKTTRKSTKVKREVLPKTPKERIAKQLGICPPQRPGQTIPQMKVQTNRNMDHMRVQAGIPSLHLFGQRNQLEYFSQSESDVEGGSGVNVLRSRRPNVSDAAVFRRAARNKASASIATSTNSSDPFVDVLGNILDAQSKLHSKANVISVKQSGAVSIGTESKMPLKNKNFWNDERRPGVAGQRGRVRQTPMTPTSVSNNAASTTNGNSSSQCGDRTSYNYENIAPTSTISSAADEQSNRSRDNGGEEGPQDYSLNHICSTSDGEDSKRKSEKDAKDESTNEKNSDSELDIYSDIETVSTSKLEDADIKYSLPSCDQLEANRSTNTPDDDNESDVDLIIDTEKSDPDKYDPANAFESDNEGGNTTEEPVTSTSESATNLQRSNPIKINPCSEIQSETVQSSNETATQQTHTDEIAQNNESEEPEDDCPNFSIYSSESLKIAKNTDVNWNKSEEDVALSTTKTYSTRKEHTGLYSDSEDETFVKINPHTPFGISDLRNMTEDISEEERSYTPCLDEREPILKEGLEGLDTEMISDDDKNDFEETQELKTVSDGDALEINAKESELDFSRPEDCEEGEIVDKSKNANVEEPKEPEEPAVASKPNETSSPNDKEEEIVSAASEPVFKKLSKSNKERNYRDKENRERSKSKEKRERAGRESKRDRRKEKRREIERYDVRSLVETRPKRDKFGRDLVRRRSHSNSPARKTGRQQTRRSRSNSTKSPSPRLPSRDTRKKSLSVSTRSGTPKRSPSRVRKSQSPDKTRKRRQRSMSRSKSRGRRRSRSRPRKRRQSVSKDRDKLVKSSADKSKLRRRKGKSKSRSPRRNNWEPRHSRGWSQSISRSRTPELRHLTPSWTPPRTLNQSVRPQNLTVILPNDSNKKRKERRKRVDKRGKETVDKQRKRKRSDRSPVPSKEVFASGNNILVSVSFNKDNEVRETRIRRRREPGEELITKRIRKEKEKQVRPRIRKRPKNITNVKPVAIIDLDRSPFKEITPSPKDVIVLSDSDNADCNDLLGMQNGSQQAASPEETANNYVNMGPKTPPEPQVKFSFPSKQPQLRQINNPLHDPDEVEEDIDPQEELENRLNEVMHKGPNTPPEPPNSPPSSPDAYDPFDPTKSRSPTPEPKQSSLPSNITQTIEDTQEEIVERSRDPALERSGTPINNSTAVRSHTPPIPVPDIQPADSQSSIRAITPDTNIGSSPERPIGVIINQMVQSQAAASKTIAATTYSSVSTSLITSTPISSNLAVTRANSSVTSAITPAVVTSSIPPRISLPNILKSSPINKVAPMKTLVKPAPMKSNSKNVGKPMSSTKPTSWKNKGRANENNEAIDFESPYSPGSSDYDDLFEPPPDTAKTTNVAKTGQAAKNTKSPSKSTFDILFGSSPVYANKNKNSKNKSKVKKTHVQKGTKQVGVKLDEDNLKILDELPNSAVEMQVKDKFLKKLNRQERVVEEVKFVLKPYYNKKRVTKSEYKDILRRAVPKICHNKSGEINPKKIQQLVEAYVKKLRHNKKVTSSSSAVVNPQKTEVVSNWLSKLS